jgi:SPX domain protein involved in polyphosphate accumulation
MEKKLDNELAKKKMKPEQVTKLKRISFDIQSEIIKKNLLPTIRTVCRRTAFQKEKGF